MSFTKDIKRFNKHAGDNMNKVVRMAFVELSTRVIRRSPVGDASFWKGSKPKGYTGGRFRANWQASIDSPKEGTVNSTNQSAARTSVSGAAKARKARGFYLMNNLPYAKALENGHSRQAPNGIVKLAAAEWQSIVRMVNGMVR